MRRAKILGTGSYLPKRILTNFDLEKIVDTTDEWIRTRTGMVERRIADDNETTSDMAYAASLEAISKSGLKSSDIDGIIVATITPDMNFPSNACLIQDRLEIPSCIAFDFNAACSGFVYGLHIANSLIASGAANNILVVGSEKLSSITDYTDRNTCVLFGDGAGAVVLGASKTTQGVRGTFVGSDGSKSELLKRHAGQTRSPINKMGIYDYKQQYIFMDGKAIFKSAVHRMTSSLAMAVERADLKLGDLNMVIPHQANLRIIESVKEFAKLNDDQIFVNIHKTGNTSSASIPIALDEAIKAGKLQTGHILGLTAFGGGLTFGAAVIEM